MPDPTQTDAAVQTVILRKGNHASPARGACVMELASMLAGERFSDHPAAVCPVLAAFLRGYNDAIPSGQEDELYPYASLVVGTHGSRRVGAERARRLLEWAGAEPARGRTARWSSPWPTDWDATIRPAVRFAVRLEPAARRAEAVAQLLAALVDLGGRAREPFAAPRAARVASDAQRPASSGAGAVSA